MALDVLGHGVGLLGWIPGGVFEVTSGLLLPAKGFPAEQSLDRNRITDQATPSS